MQGLFGPPKDVIDPPAPARQTQPMSDQKPPKAQPASTEPPSRRDKQAEALRANLAKRKQQQRARTEPPNSRKPD
ncbi:hypothetical protein JCM17960_07960 [Magnetospira thiophila]